MVKRGVPDTLAGHAFHICLIRQRVLVLDHEFLWTVFLGGYLGSNTTGK